MRKNWKEIQIRRTKEYKSELGLLPTTANLRLSRSLLFNYAKRLGMGNCFRCGKEIISIEDFTLDHKQEWRHNDPRLFWDIDNIAFSHQLCNASSNRVARFYQARTHKKCNECKEEKDLNSFGTRIQRGQKRYRSFCNECRNKRKKEGKSY
jgi:hypothetical protein